MTRKLSDDDRKAVDLLLDQQLSPDAMGGGRAGFAPPSTDALRARLRNLQTVLGVLSALPAEEPSSDLVARTMSRIEGSTATAPQVPADAAFFGLNQPMA
jgi:hypothetical protein